MHIVYSCSSDGPAQDHAHERRDNAHQVEDVPGVLPEHNNCDVCTSGVALLSCRCLAQW